MNDTNALALSAEHYISNRLYRYKILSAKPFFDRDGADLLAMRSVNDSARFIRVQSKGRTITKNKKSALKIPKSYVSSDFVVFLYIEFELERNIEITSFLYCFFQSDIGFWSQDEEYFTLTIPTDFYKRDYFIENEFNETKAKQLIDLIENIEQDKEFYKLLPNEAEMLKNSLKIWRAVNIFPDANMLELFSLKIPIKIMSIQQLIFLYYSSFLKHDELLHLNDEVNYELLFSEIREYSNTKKDIFSEFKLVKIISLSKGIINDYLLYNKYFIAEIVVEYELETETGVYIFCRDNEGEGMEMILLKDDHHTYQVRHITHSARKVDIEISRNLFQTVKKTFV